MAQVDAKARDQLIADPDRLRQIITNLISNAVKFTVQGGAVVLAVRRLGASNGREVLEFSVVDSGIGIAQEKCQTIFEAFTQADASTTRKYGGTGLGLTIAARLVGLMGGELKVRSRMGAGSVFYFVLEVPTWQETDQVLVHAQNAKVPKAPLEVERMRILLTEDNVINQKVARRLLEKAGHEVCVANDGSQALALLDEQSFDLVLMDVQMPVMDGFTATREIRLREKSTGKHIPIIGLTAHALVGDKEKCFDAGMDDYVGKPIDRAKLFEAVARCTGRSADS